MDTVLLLLIPTIISAGTGYIGYRIGTKQTKKPLTEEEKIKLKRESEEKQWQNLFTYSETIATRGYKNEE